ncbi:MAG: hypothetical protein KJ796_09095 [Alphaproteobacteria bacterium]|nr:hypothetical protein [Alphaproteobacteria bacterium]MBU2191553.1 hypothetical protein [Alphaproteobacteria bacterium]
MLRTIVAVLIAIVIALHMVAPASAAGQKSVQVISLLDDTTVSGRSLDQPDGGDGASQPPAHATTKCHDQCHGFTIWASQNVLRKSPLPIENRAKDFPPTSIAIVVPPPRPVE